MASAASLAGNWTISTLAGSTPYCCRITLSKLTLASVRPTTPMRRPASWTILVIFGAAFLPLTLAAGGTHSTATFLRSVATAWAFFGTSRSPRMMARSALPSASACGARLGAIGLHRAQPDLAARRDEGLRQRLHHLDVIAVGRADRDPQRHRAHRIVVDPRDRADHGKEPCQHDEHQPPFRRARRLRHRRLDRLESLRSSISQTIV